MRIRATQSIRSYALFMLVTFMFSCDSFEDNDSIKPALTQSDYYTLPGTSIIIDISSFTKQSYTDLSVSISGNPTKGELTTVDPLLLKYKPSWEFEEGEDQFVLTAKRKDKILTSQTVTIHLKETKEEFACGIISVQDMAEVNPGSSVSISVLDNDWFCDVAKSDLKISIHLNPLYGESVIDGESIRYTPGIEYESQDEFIYKVTNSEDESVYYGIVSIGPVKFTDQ
jgi:hypothetical protein